MVHRNPFEARRWEDSERNIVFVPSTITDIAGTENVYIAGIRGSGKTTILNTLNYHLRKDGGALFYNEEYIPSGCLGTYTHILNQFTTVFSYLESESGELHFDVFSLYFHCLSLADAFHVISTARSYGDLVHTPEDEIRFVKSVMEKFSFLSNFRKNKNDTLLALSSTLRKICMKIRVDTLRGELDHVINLIAELHPTEFYTFVSQSLRKSNILEMRDSQRAYISICIDNTHFLKRNHQKFLNTIVQGRLAPFCYKIAYGKGLFDPAETIHTHLPLSSHDRTLHYLDYEDKPSDFNNMCRDIFWARLSHHFNYDQKSFGVEDKTVAGGRVFQSIYGRPSVNLLFSSVLDLSSKKQVHSYFDDQFDSFEQWYTRNIKIIKSRKNNINRERLYSQYVIFRETFDGNIDLINDTAKRVGSSRLDNYFRQKSWPSLVWFCANVGGSVPWAGANLIESISDGCVRDFLSLNRFVFEQSERGKEIKYYNPSSIQRISERIQGKAIKNASENFISNIQYSPEQFMNRVCALMEALGALMYIAQTARGALKSPERGIFSIDFSDRRSLHAEALPEDIERLVAIIAKGQDMGVFRVQSTVFIRGINNSYRGRLDMRLHRMVSPTYKVSTRGPFRSVRVPLAKVLEITRGYGVSDPKAWASSVAKEALKESAPATEDEMLQYDFEEYFD